ncbi:MAG: FAD-binding oxidoreductase [Candidatus Omnitrophota bacterium]|nr:FAD-binding oxidoreductase [Candidatus Omnitrophota bacterium]
MIIKQNQDEIQSYLEDASNFRSGRAEALYVPEDEAEIVQAVVECSREKIPLTINGGGTGTVAGRIPVGGRILTVEKLDRILSIESERKQASLQAGVLVDNFLKLLKKDSLFYPPFPTERTAFISGNASTNASGEYSYYFGPTRRYVERLKVVLSDGEIVEIRRGETFADRDGFCKIGSKKVKIPSYATPDIKCSAGYFCRPGMDAIDLFIGSEGTLGIFTEVDVSLIPALPNRVIMVFFFENVGARFIAPAGRINPTPTSEGRLFEFLSAVKNDKALSALTLEYFDSHSLDFLRPDFPNIPECRFALYVEALESSLEKWLDLLEGYPIVDTWVGQDAKSYQTLIDFRHRLPENINAYFKKIGSQKVSLDFAVPEDRFPELYAYYQNVRETNTDVETILFGHIGENHLHFNYFPKDQQEKERVSRLYEEAARKVISMGGTIAAEHGIGKLKHKYLEMMYGKEGILQMAAVKKILDPACILGLDNIFPRTLL